MAGVTRGLGQRTSLLVTQGTGYSGPESGVVTSVLADATLFARVKLIRRVSHAPAWFILEQQQVRVERIRLIVRAEVHATLADAMLTAFAQVTDNPIVIDNDLLLIAA